MSTLGSIAIIGAGAMGGAILGGLLAPGVTVDGDIRVTNRTEAKAALVRRPGVGSVALETTPDGELVCTLTSTWVLAPKLRYNIGDEARLLGWDALHRILGRRREWSAGADAAFATERMKLPLLFVFGRADATISFMGANIYPQDVENGLYADERAAALTAHRGVHARLGGRSPRRRGCRDRSAAGRPPAPASPTTDSMTRCIS